MRRMKKLYHLGDVDNEGGDAYVGGREYMGISVSAAQFCSSKTFL